MLLSEEEGLNEALNISKEKILLKLGKKGKIIEQKVLKKYVKNSTMYVEVLVSTNEEIGVIEVY